MRARTLIVGGHAIAALCGLLGDAGAQVRPEAETLFRDGKELMKQGKTAEACAAFEASEKAGHSISTVLSLADCREKNQQYASAWALFLEADSQTRLDASKAAFNRTARARALALEPRLSYLTINVPDESRIPGLVVLRDGIEVDSAAWNTPIPIDGGPHEISGKAPGRESWSTKVTIAPERDKQSVAVPKFKELQPLVRAEPVLPPPREVPAPGPLRLEEPRRMGMALTLRIAPGLSSASGDNFASDLASVGSTSIGVELAFPLGRYLWLAAGASYDPLGVDYELLVGEDVAMLHEKVTYLQLPLTVRLEAPIRASSTMLRVFGRGGLSFDLAAQHGGTFEIAGGSGSLSDPELAWYDEHGSFNIGALFGAGLEVGLAKMPSIYLGVDVTHERHLMGEWSDAFFANGANFRYNATRFGLSLKYQHLK